MNRIDWLTTCLIALMALMTIMAASPLSAQVSDAERKALIRFYHATGGENWTDNSNWLKGAGTECSWTGVQCTHPQSQPRVVLRLMLPDNNLTGELPASLAGLDHLVTLTLNDNDLSGAIPEDLWGLVALQTLILDNNRLEGTIPAAILGMRKGMPITQVSLSGNPLTGFGADPVPASPTPELELWLNNTLIDQLPPAAWRATGVIRSLGMARSGLEGELDLSAPWPGLERLDLAGNAIAAIDAVDDNPLPDLARLDLADNDLTQWPALPDLPALSKLIVRDNQLSGPLPGWFGDLQLGHLDLDNNRLDGPIAEVFAGLDLDGYPQYGPHGDLGLRLYVANNDFSGALPAIDYTKFNTPYEGQASDFGLDLCFNDITLPEPDRLAAIDAVHRGHDLAGCTGRTQTALDAAISGSWYQPMRSGEGMSLMLLENGGLLGYWFTYAPDDNEVDEPQQRWFLGLTDPASSWAEFRPLLKTAGGQFGLGLGDGEAKPSRAWTRLHQIDADTLHFFYDYRSPGLCITGACFWDVDTDRFDLARLSRLAGTRCDTHSPFQQYSGAWYSPERSGEGFIVEVLPEDRRLLVYWFTYTPDDTGEQAWMIGDGQFTDPNVIIDPPPPFEESASVTLYQPSGTYFGRDFDPEAIDNTEWGQLTLRFYDENTGKVVWNSHLESYGSGEYEITRLARPMLADCD